MSDEEILSLRARVRNLHDKVDEHSLKLAAIKVQIEGMAQQMIVLLSSMSTREQLASVMLTSKQQLDAAVELMTEKLKNVQDDLKPIRSGINWAVGIVLGAVLLALIALVVKQ